MLRKTFFAAATRDGFTWVFIVHIPLLGKPLETMNMGNFGSLRKYMQRKGTPFIWPGSKAQWNGISDVMPKY
jgi:hypothetical protein